MLSFRSAFTLIELLIVIGIIAILAVAVVLVLNPVELLRQSRDATRLSDMSTLSKSVQLYEEDIGGSLGTASTTYLSIPDPLATSTAGDQCQGLGLPSLSSGWTYQCASSSTYKNVDGTGWIPVNLKSASFGSSIGSLPVDPTNTTSSGLYYTYTPGAGFTYALTATMESQKYLTKATQDGGYDPARYETGTNLALVAQWEGLVGWWKFDEGSGSTAADSSGNGNDGTWSGTQAGQNGYYSPGKVGAYAGYFDGTDDYVGGTSGLPKTAGPWTLCAWMKPNTSQFQIVANTASVNSCTGFGLGNACSGSNPAILASDEACVWCGNTSQGTYAIGTWNFICDTLDSNDARSFFIGTPDLSSIDYETSGVGSGGPLASDGGFVIGERNGAAFFDGLLDDVRIYSRALSAAEIQNIYNAEK